MIGKRKKVIHEYNTKKENKPTVAKGTLYMADFVEMRQDTITAIIAATRMAIKRQSAATGNEKITDIREVQIDTAGNTSHAMMMAITVVRAIDTLMEIAARKVYYATKKAEGNQEAWKISVDESSVDWQRELTEEVITKELKQMASAEEHVPTATLVTAEKESRQT